MKREKATASVRGVVLVLSCVLAWVTLATAGAQSTPYERTLTQSKATVEKALKDLQPFTAGRLPVLDGFTTPGDRPLDRFQRGYYQCTVQVRSTLSGGSLVQVSAKITAWYADPVSSKSGYAVLPSNGRLENDLLDRLEEKLAGKGTPSAAPIAAVPPPSRPKSKPDASAPTISAPMPSGMATSFPAAPSKAHAASPASPFQLSSPAGGDQVASLATQKAVADKHIEDLTKQAKNLEEIIRTQAHPNNLAAVKKSGTPVLVGASEGAKVLFLASAEDEFEILDTTASWVHVRISGLSRGWILRSSLEMPGGSTAATQPAQAQSAGASEAKGSEAVNAKPFQIESEQIASFPGTWEPLRGRTVKIVSLQTSSNGSSADSQAKLDYVKSLFDREYKELAQSSSSAVGVVLIFDSEDGGMVATTLPVLQQWKAGSLSDEGLWRRCLFDPPEMFNAAASR
jgi:hypothetical protein